MAASDRGGPIGDRLDGPTSMCRLCGARPDEQLNACSVCGGEISTYDL